MMHDIGEPREMRVVAKPVFDTERERRQTPLLFYVFGAISAPRSKRMDSRSGMGTPGNALLQRQLHNTGTIMPHKKEEKAPWQEAQ